LTNDDEQVGLRLSPHHSDAVNHIVTELVSRHPKRASGRPGKVTRQKAIRAAIEAYAQELGWEGTGG
jgi:hypothetical protein